MSIGYLSKMQQELKLPNMTHITKLQMVVLSSRSVKTSKSSDSMDSTVATIKDSSHNLASSYAAKSAFEV